MLTTLCLLFLIYSILKRPVGWLAKKLETVDWKSLSQDAWEKIVLYSKKGGRSVCRPILQLYYGMIEGDFTVLDKVLIYAGIGPEIVTAFVADLSKE